MQCYETHDISYSIVKEEFRGLILATTVWFEVLAGFYYCYLFFAISKRKNDKNAIS